MGSTYAGKSANITGALPAGVAIASSTNANPIVITTSAAHGLVDQTDVDITNHQVNTKANGIWPATVLSPTTFSIPVAGNGVGGATGQVQSLAPGAAATIFGDGDAGNAANFNNPSIASLDRAAFFAQATGASKIAQVVDFVSIEGTHNFLSWLAFQITASNTPTVITTSLFTIPNVTILDTLYLSFCSTMIGAPAGMGIIGIGLQVSLKVPGGGGAIGFLQGGTVGFTSTAGANYAVSLSGAFPVSSFTAGGISGGLAVVDLYAIATTGSLSNTLHLGGDWNLNGVVMRSTGMPQ